MTRYELEILLHHDTSLAKFPRWTAPAYESTVAGLMNADLLMVDDRTPSESRIRTTQLGNMLIELMLQTPKPECVWIDPRTGKKVVVG